MSRRTRRLIAIAAGVLGAVIPAPDAVSQDAIELPSPGRSTFPFSFQPDSMPGPPRAMGMAPFGQGLPPSDMATPLSGPPRVMGASPFFPTDPGPFTPFTPSVTPGGTFFPGLIPGQGGTLAPGIAPQPDALLTLPGLLGREPIGGQPAADGRELDPFELPEAPGLQLGAPSVPRGAPRVDNLPPEPPLMLEVVRGSAERRYPPFLAILEQRNVAEGDLTSARGSFDLNVNLDSRNYPLGFYDRSVQDLFLEQPILASGGKVFSGYRLAQGQFPVYYNYLNTRGGGAFVNGFEQPLLQNLRIDPKRAKLYQTEIERRKVEPTILKERVSLLKDAAKAYWAWVAAGQAYAVYQDLLELSQAQFRALAEQASPEIGRVAQVDVIAFQAVLIKRQQEVVNARRDLQQAAVFLSFYLRDLRGLPSMPDVRQIPLAFPDAERPDQAQVERDVAVALRLRPEIFSLMLEYDKAEVDRDLAENLLLPKLNFYVYTEQNVGVRDVDLGSDFRPFILESSLFFDVPLQRRYARGRVRAADAVLRQISARTQFARDQIQADVLNAAASLRAAYESLAFYRNNEVVYRQLAEAERQRLEIQAASPLLFFVVRQQQVLDAQVLRVLAEGKYFSALADYRAAVGLDAVTPEVARTAPPTILPEDEIARPMSADPDAVVPADPIPPPPAIFPGLAPGAPRPGAIPPGPDAAPGAAIDAPVGPGLPEAAPGPIP
ncbi:TolC family protein [Tautonia plasticadhaerens]|uniref:Outer membrane efflux protein n=1 Tax=Tautonia plasticadhaerens TaxID=2527974 RepID=A0A518H6K1_9BACT|nr:TolC family protein [Tautonia plasticadhaerens]QDV36477.1 Outer membrane efflux protein [Tautonia plasticadhaerens]